MSALIYIYVMTKATKAPPDSRRQSPSPLHKPHWTIKHMLWLACAHIDKAAMPTRWCLWLTLALHRKHQLWRMGHWLAKKTDLQLAPQGTAHYTMCHQSVAAGLDPTVTINSNLWWCTLFSGREAFSGNETKQVGFSRVCSAELEERRSLKKLFFNNISCS